MERVLKYDSVGKVRDRLEQLIKEPAVVNACARFAKDNPNLEETLAICKKIADIDLKGIDVDKELIEGKNFLSDQEVKDFALGFYRALDILAGEGENLEKVVNENFKYMHIVHNGGRACCGRGGKANEKWIHVNMEGRITDPCVALHELGHSLSKDFRNFKDRKDNSVTEVFPVIVDLLSSLLMTIRFPQYMENLQEVEIERQIINVVKARQSLVEAELVKFINGQSDFDNAAKLYWDYFGNNLSVISRTLEAIDDALATKSSHRVIPMYEARYLIPQAIAVQVVDRFKQDPQKAAKQIKTILANDTTWTMSEMIEFLGLGSKDKVVDDYVASFHSRVGRQIDDEDEMDI